MARVVIYGLSIRTDRTDRQKGYTVCKECFTVRKSHLISGTYNIFMARVTVCRSVRIERIDKRGIRSVKSVLRSVNRISLVGLKDISMARVVIHRFSICKDGTDRRKGSTVCEELSSVRKVREVHVSDHWVPIT